LRSKLCFLLCPKPTQAYLSFIIMFGLTESLHLNIKNQRLKGLTSRVICLSGCAAILVIIGMVVGFFDKDEELQEFHTSSTSEASSTNTTAASPMMKIAGYIIVALLALAVPCCGYWGARHSNRICLACFSCCNCLGGCCSIVLIILSILAMASLGTVQETCRPTAGSSTVKNCEGIMQACKNLQSEKYTLDTYEGCYDYMVASYPYVYAALGVAIALRCCSVGFECASAYWGKELYDALDEDGECIHESDYEA